MATNVKPLVIHLALLAGCALLTLPLTGCLTNHHRDDDSSSSSRDDRSYPRDSGRGGDRAPDIDGVPRAAWSVTGGSGELNWKADDDGTIYVVDADDNDLIVQHHIERDQHVHVLPDDNRVKIDDQTISRKDLTSNHVHRIYVVRDHGNGPRDADHDGDRDHDRNDRNR